MKYETHMDGEWFRPRRHGWKLRCCDCGLIHTVNFRLVKKSGRIINRDAGDPRRASDSETPKARVPKINALQAGRSRTIVEARYMNAITIQKRPDGKFVLTLPHQQPDPTLCEQPETVLGFITQEQLTNLAPDMAIGADGINNIPHRLENQSRMIRGFANQLECVPAEAAIHSAIIGGKHAIKMLAERNELFARSAQEATTAKAALADAADRLGCGMSKREISAAIANLKRGREESDKRWVQACAERDGLNKMFAGVKVTRNAQGKITNIRATHTTESVGGCEISFADIYREARHDSKTPTETPYEHGKPITEGVAGLEIAGQTETAFTGRDASFDWRCVQLCERCGAEQPETATAFPVDCVHCGARLPAPVRNLPITSREEAKAASRKACLDEMNREPEPGVMTSTREPRKATFSIREATRRIREMGLRMFGGSNSVESDQVFDSAAGAIIEEFTGHKEQLIQELRTLWTQRSIRQVSGAAVINHGAQLQITDLLASPPVFHEPGEMIFTAKQMEAIKNSRMVTREELLEAEVRAFGDEAAKLRRECGQLESDLKLACQQRAAAILENERLKTEHEKEWGKRLTNDTLIYALGLAKEARDEAKTESRERGLLLETAWGVIANAWGGDWNKADSDWQKAAKKFRDDFHKRTPLM